MAKKNWQKSSPFDVWFEEKMKGAVKGHCPFCNTKVDLITVAGESNLHHCPYLPKQMKEVRERVFSKDEVLLVGRFMQVVKVMCLVSEKKPNVRFWAIVPMH